jgi:hypothetical protein
MQYHFAVVSFLKVFSSFLTFLKGRSMAIHLCVLIESSIALHAGAYALTALQSAQSPFPLLTRRVFHRIRHKI